MSQHEISNNLYNYICPTTVRYRDISWAAPGGMKYKIIAL